MKYNPDIIKSDRKTVQLSIRPDGKLVVRAPKNMTLKQIEKYIEEKSAWIENTLKKVNRQGEADVEPFTHEEVDGFIKKAKEIIPPRVKYYGDLMGLNYNKIAIKIPKTRWGSCSSKKNLNFNALLILMPPEVMDSVIVHELCHLKEMNHSKRFYNEIYKVMPNYDEYDKWLKQNGFKYLAKLEKK